MVKFPLIVTLLFVKIGIIKVMDTLKFVVDIRSEISGQETDYCLYQKQTGFVYVVALINCTTSLEVCLISGVNMVFVK